MTQWQEFPLRPQGRPWPGINTLGGELDDGSGLLKDTSTNVQINRGDTLAKRKGMVRGLDERFVDVVCGLHKYTDECGVEWLLVADQDSIKIRQPFAIPIFENSDAYPFDNFAGDGQVDPSRWRNTDGYTKVAGTLQITAPTLPPMGWFKEATSLSYQTRIQFAFDRSTDVAQEFRLIIKAAEQAATGARLEARLSIPTAADDVVLQLVFVAADLSESILLSAGGGSATTGFLTVTYRADDRVAGVQYFPQLADQFVRDADPLTALQDADLGQFSALQLDGATSAVRVLVIDGGPI